MSFAEPLEQLLFYVDDPAGVPDAWIAEHAPTGSLERLWSQCDDVDVMISLAALTCDHRSLVRAACACAQSVVPHLPTDLRREAVAELDLSMRADADAHALGSAADRREARLMRGRAVGQGPVASSAHLAEWAVHGAIVAAAAAAGDATGRFDEVFDVEAGAYHAAVTAAASLKCAELDPSSTDVPEVDGKSSPRIAAILRAHLECPTLDEVRSGQRRMLEREAGDRE